jgi:hypothetical protein
MDPVTTSPAPVRRNQAAAVRCIKTQTARELIRILQHLKHHSTPAARQAFTELQDTLRIQT